jgi:chemotaxis protein histidine kinase CheA
MNSLLRAAFHLMIVDVGDYSMSIDIFADRLARVRRRFASTLQGRIDDTSASLDKLAAKAPAAATAVGEVYRCVHGIVGVGPTVGFPATGRAAHGVEDVLRPAQNERRGLSADEMARVKERLIELRTAAEREMQDFYRELKVTLS